MRLSLQTAVQKAAFVAVGLLAVSGYIGLAVRNWVAYHYAHSQAQPEGLKRATRLDPTNAEYPELLGRRLFSVDQDAAAAIPFYIRAVTLNPHVARYWLDLASAHLASGDAQGHRKALDTALEAEPTDPNIAWESANLLLVQGEFEPALRTFRVVIENDPLTRTAALQLCWRATHNVEQILATAVPTQPDVTFALLDVVLRSDDAAAAEKVWQAIRTQAKPFPPARSFWYLDYLLKRGDLRQAKTVWQDVIALNGLRGAANPDNLIFNPNFDETVLNGGFDWRYQNVPGVQVAVDSGNSRVGSRSLEIQFLGEPAGDAGIRQLILVEPKTEYEFSAYVKTDSIVSGSGPRLSLADAFTGASYALTEELHGSHPWMQLRLRFTTGADTHVLSFSVHRNLAQLRIKGNMWIDDLLLRRTGAPAERSGR